MDPWHSAPDQLEEIARSVKLIRRLHAIRLAKMVEKKAFLAAHSLNAT
jgi:hypothetical protein